MLISLKVDSTISPVEYFRKRRCSVSRKSTSQADGSYNGVFYNLDYSRGFREPTDVTFLGTFWNGRNASKFNRNEIGAYRLTREGDKLRKFKVFTPFSSQKNRYLQCTIPKLITNYRRHSRVNRKVVGTQWKSTKKTSPSGISLPGNTSKETLRA